MKAFDLAEKYQCPVFVLSDENMSTNRQTIEDLDQDKTLNRRYIISQEELDRIGKGEYKRYLLTEDGTSTRSLPSMANGDYTSQGNEHDEYGGITEDTSNRVRMMDKRLRKLSSARRELKETSTLTFGHTDADLGLIGTGSTKGAILEAMDTLELDGINVKFLQIRVLWPFPVEPVTQFVDSCRRIAAIEHNATGQLARIIKSEVPIANMVSILKYDGTPFKPREIYSRLSEVMG